MNVPRGCRLGIVLVDTRVYSTQSTSRVLPPTSRTSYSRATAAAVTLRLVSGVPPTVTSARGNPSANKVGS